MKEDRLDRELQKLFLYHFGQDILEKQHSEGLMEFKQLISIQCDRAVAKFAQKLSEESSYFREDWGDGSGYDETQAVPISIINQAVSNLKDNK